MSESHIASLPHISMLHRRSLSDTAIPTLPRKQPCKAVTFEEWLSGHHPGQSILSMLLHGSLVILTNDSNK